MATARHSSVVNISSPNAQRFALFLTIVGSLVVVGFIAYSELGPKGSESFPERTGTPGTVKPEQKIYTYWELCPGYEDSELAEMMDSGWRIKSTSRSHDKVTVVLER